MSKNDSTFDNPADQNRKLTWAHISLCGVEFIRSVPWARSMSLTPLIAIAFGLGVQTSVPAWAGDWGYESDYADDKENDPKFGDQKSNIRAPRGRDPIRQADDIDGGDQGGVEELDAAPAGALNAPKGSKPAAKPAAKPASKTGKKPGSTAKPVSKSTRNAEPDDPELHADPSTFGSSDRPGSDLDSNSNSNSNMDSNLDSTSNPEPSQGSDSTSDANFERDPVYREGISLPPTKVPVSQQAKIINAWLNVFGLCAPIENRNKLPKGPDFTTQFTDEQKARFTVTLKKLLNSKEQAGYKQIENYWSALSRLLQDVDHRSNYRVLFRALLSMRADAKDIGEDERAMLHEALGPKRIAEIGPPPLTEDAIEAYTDMTCFLYEQSHAGKTVDADDNRALYAMIIRDKFKKAPTDRDRMAMNQFPLSWAKFRILYTDANPSEKILLAERIASEQGTRGLGIRNAMLEQVLSSPVWMRFVVGSNKVMATSNTGAAKPAAPPRSTAGSALRSHGLNTAPLSRSLDSLSRELDREERSYQGEEGGALGKKYPSRPPASTTRPKRNW